VTEGGSRVTILVTSGKPDSRPAGRSPAGQRAGGRRRHLLDQHRLTDPPVALRPWASASDARSVDVIGKLQIKPGQSVAMVNPPPGMVVPGVPVASAADADAVVAFVARREDLEAAEPALAAARADRLAWISYPKSGKLGTDLNRDRLVAALAEHGVQPVRQVALDDTWSALRFRPARE